MPEQSSSTPPSAFTARPPRLSTFVFLGGLLIAMLGSGWAWAGSHSCSACAEAARKTGALNLGALGVAFYGLLLVIAVWLKRARLAAIMVLAAAGVHFSLLSVLITGGIYCPACCLTAAGAFVAAGASVSLFPNNIGWALGLIPICGIVTNLLMMHFR